ncbi:MAG TPA: glycosyltransferase family 4 protein [Candidatus Binataceae bacterium]|nr:glycosyltransferase family 4 protein [Candidatus Binataceae bacterium]
MEAPLSIAGVDPERNFAGGESQVLGLTVALKAAGHRADLICDPAGALWERARAARIECHPLRIRNSIDAAAGLRLRALLARERYDVIHFHTARAHALAPFARGRAGALIVTRRMDYAPNRLFAPWLYNRAVDGVAAISPAVADALVRAGVARDRLALIPSGVDCAWFRPPTVTERRAARAALGLAPWAVAVGTVGMLEARKGQRYLLEGLALIAARRPAPDARAGAIDGAQVQCFIAGAGAQAAALAAQIGRCGLGGSVRMLGALDDPRALLWALDIFAMPSLAEGLGVAALEAMACGLAVIASAAGGLADAVVDEVTGMLVAPGDAAAIAAAIMRMTMAPAWRAALGAAGRARVAEKFALEAMARRTLELYRQCLAHGRE